MEGRDIGTVVFPDAEVKIFLDANPEERVRRRYREIRGKGEPAPITEGQLARFLRCDRVTAREIVQEYLTSRDVNEEGQTEAVQFEQTEQSLL